jgi:hypothetical protein
MAILIGFALCLVLADVALGKVANQLVVVGVGCLLTVGLVVGWRWSAASREKTLRPSTALTIGSVALLVLGIIYLAVGGRL